MKQPIRRLALAVIPALAVTSLAAAASAATPAVTAGPKPHQPTVIHARPQAHPATPIKASGTVHAVPGHPVTLPRLTRPRPAAAARPAARTISPHATDVTAGQILTNADGLSGPAGTGWAVSAATNGTRTLEAAGVEVSAYDNSGNQVCAQIPLGQLLPDGTHRSAQVLYDNGSNRFILMSHELRTSGSSTPAIDIAVSDTSDPCGTWFPYHLTLSGDPFGPGSCLEFPSLGQTSTAVLVGLSNDGGIGCGGSDASTVFAIPKDDIYAHVTLSFPVFDVSAQAGVAAMDSAGKPMVSSPAGFFVLAVPGGAGFGGYALYRMDGADSGNPSVTAQAFFSAPFDEPTEELTQPGTSTTLVDFDAGNIQASPVWDGSRLWFAHTIGSPGGSDVTVRYGYISPATGTLQIALASHAPDSADLNPSIGVGVAPNGVDTVFLNWATIDVAKDLPNSDTAALMLYNSGSLPTIQGSDSVLITGGTPANGGDVFALWSAVSVDPATLSGTCAETAQQYRDSSGTWHTRLARICGPAQVTVPNLNGDTVATAGTVLQGSFLAAGNQDQTTACTPAVNGLVATTTPGAAQQAPLGSAVTLHVCDLNVTVPNVLQDDDTTARNAITAAGLTVSSVTMTASCTVARGDVITQNPQGGTQALRGSGVILSESTGRQPNGKPCVFN